MSVIMPHVKSSLPTQVLGFVHKNPCKHQDQFLGMYAPP